MTGILLPIMSGTSVVVVMLGARTAYPGTWASGGETSSSGPSPEVGVEIGVDVATGVSMGLLSGPAQVSGWSHRHGLL